MSVLMELNNVSFYFDKGKHNETKALDSISLKVPEGGFVGIVGTPGAGKSTLLDILSGIILPTEGEYLFKGENMAKKSAAKRAKMRNAEFGFVLQDFGLLGANTGLENVCLPLRFRRIAPRMIEKMGLEIMEKMNILHLKDRKVSELSGGECQKIAIARALVHKPSVLFADEPTGGLDEINTVLFIEQLAKINKEGVTIVIVTHDTKALRSCSSIYSLTDGRLEEVKQEGA